MSLVTDWIGVGGALAVAFGSGIQAVQAFDQLDDETPITTVQPKLLLAALRALFSVVIPATNPGMAPTLKRLGLASEAIDTLIDEARNAQEGTDEARKAQEAIEVWVKNLKKWLGLFLGWFFISIGALAALAAAAWMLAIDW